MSNILAISAKKSGGKTTATNFIFGLEMLSLNLIDRFTINPEGRLVVPAKFEGEDEIKEVVFDPLAVNNETYEYLATNIWPSVKQYNFADPLKKDVCMGILGLTYQQCYGTDAQKNELCHLKWEDMPGVTTEKLESEKPKSVNGRLGKYYDIINGLVYHPPGFMSCREVMQFAGTEIFRKMYSEVWVEATVRKINAEAPRLALIGDCRFPNEVTGTQKAGGKVVRFTRNPYPEDTHPSETSLDEDKFDHKNFDAILDNSSMTIDEQNNALYEILKGWGMLSYELDFKDNSYVSK